MIFLGGCSTHKFFCENEAVQTVEASLVPLEMKQFGEWRHHPSLSPTLPLSLNQSLLSTLLLEDCFQLNFCAAYQFLCIHKCIPSFLLSFLSLFISHYHFCRQMNQHPGNPQPAFRIQNWKPLLMMNHKNCHHQRYA